MFSECVENSDVLDMLYTVKELSGISISFQGRLVNTDQPAHHQMRNSWKHKRRRGHNLTHL